LTHICQNKNKSSTFTFILIALRKEEDELLERMGISHNFNEANLSRIVQFLKGETYLPFEDGQSSSDNNHSESDSDNDLMGNYREKKGSKKKL
jgi:hypothetical protein